jgi:hypothetical protein
MRIGERREPAIVLLLSIVTCGIYYFYWLYCVSGEIQEFLQEPDTSPGLEVLLSILTMGLYVIYWDYKTGQKIARMQGRVGLPVTDNAILYLVLNLVGFGFVNALIEQGHLNEVWNAAQQQRLPI